MNLNMNMNTKSKGRLKEIKLIIQVNQIVGCISNDPSYTLLAIGKVIEIHFPLLQR